MPFEDNEGIHYSIFLLVGRKNFHPFVQRVFASRSIGLEIQGHKNPDNLNPEIELVRQNVPGDAQLRIQRRRL